MKNGGRGKEGKEENRIAGLDHDSTDCDRNDHRILRIFQGLIYAAVDRNVDGPNIEERRD